MIQLLLDNPLLLLFVVAAIGYLLGRIKIGGSSLGVAAVLFAGLAIGSLHPDLKLPELIYQLGLVLFVYTIGLSSGPGFVASFQRKGLRDNLLVVGVLGFAVLLVIAAAYLLDLKPTLAAGLYAGSLTNTPALAGVLDYVKVYASSPLVEAMLAEPVVGYSIAYPMGVVAMILVIQLMQRLWQIDYNVEAQRVKAAYDVTANVRLQNHTIAVTRLDATSAPIRTLRKQHNWDILFGRLKRGNQLLLATDETRFQLGDLVSVVGAPEALAQVQASLGELKHEQLDLDRSQIDYRRIFVSNPKVAGHRLRDLNLPQQFGALVTRVRRGDIEFLPHGDTVLELGDRIRVVTARTRMDAVSTFFGDSYRALSEIDVLTFSIGVALGLLVGLTPLPLPGGLHLKLGLAGGPLIVAMLLAALRRTGPLVWSMPYSSNLTLRQTGLILFLAGVGTRAGYTFVTTIRGGGGLAIFGAGVVITVVTSLLILWIGYKLCKIPMGLLIGILAGLQTQPAVLGYALEQTGDDLPNIGYATVYPIAMISKILFAQLLLTFLLSN